MAKEVVYKSDFATVWYDPDKKMIHHQIHKFVFGEEYKRFLLAGMEALKKYHVKKWLSDDRNNGAMRDEDVAWGMTNWFPQTIQAGWKYWAIVQPEKVIAQMNMEALVEDFAKGGIAAKFFTDPDAAAKWLDTL
jgi:hypothetical protein